MSGERPASDPAAEGRPVDPCSGGSKAAGPSAQRPAAEAGDATLLALAADLGTPLFVYDAAGVRGRIASLRAACPGVQLRYALKANACPALLAAMAPHLDGADVTSLGEWKAAIAAGLDPARVGGTGPAKEEALVRALVASGGEVAVESVDEIVEVGQIAQSVGRPARVLLRLRPDERIHAFRLATAGPDAPFGIAEAELAEAVGAVRAAGAWVEGIGVHVHRGSQCTSAAAFLRHAAGTLALARRAEGLGLGVRTVNLGGGLGVLPGDGTRLDAAALGRGLARLADAPPALVLEPGRWLVAEEGRLLLRVRRVREGNDGTLVVLDGGFDCFLFATESQRVGPPHAARTLGRSGEERVPATLVGPACTPIDTFGRAALERPAPGDVVALAHAGAYAFGASPRGFLGRAEAREVVIDGA